MIDNGEITEEIPEICKKYLPKDKKYLPKDNTLSGRYKRVKCLFITNNGEKVTYHRVTDENVNLILNSFSNSPT